MVVRTNTTVMHQHRESELRDCPNCNKTVRPVAVERNGDPTSPYRCPICGRVEVTDLP